MKKTILVSTLAGVLALAACNPNPQGSSNAAASGAASTSASAPAGLETNEKQLSYILGYEMATQMGLSELKKNGIQIDNSVMLSAIEDQVASRPSKVSQEQAQAVMQAIAQQMQATAEKKATELKAEGEKWLADNKGKQGVQTTASGLQYSVKKEGTGAQIAKGDLAAVQYEGRLTNGEVFDTNKGGEDFAVPVVDNTVIKGWIEGLQLMKEGGEYTLYIPADLAYGNQSPSPKIPAGSVLVFDIKVNSVKKGEGAKMMQQMEAAQKAQVDAAKAAQGAAASKAH
ncbi:FKBP-type peptidyl-prolyl cis-trans isomerase [Kingella kingae]|uniref:FKBP-type peptidyl-prolyl cis-trans isomerase n=1 Tax=Kingella kingae TaxID=504 RepID=UPI0003F9F040|nr:FKBP-type peptidyl-prolyl cis-trans isomerase [Kingella kingae]MDK4575157.1 FKBP-type peptidyl-prolyl cis-trans isomerase [Kingella kingae]MDK4607307.1 FKBP-type peptidyl-prolyl cis-trans isomerase [Kingella kingae]